MWTEHRFLSFDATPLFYLRLKPASKPKTAVILVHGMGEHSGRYRHVGEHLAQNGSEVFMLDLRGFGKSGGRRAFVDTFTEYNRDLDAFHRFVAAEEKEVPIYLLAHSLGGLIAASYVAFTAHSPLAGLILSSPCFGLELKVPAWKRFLGVFGSYVTPNLSLPTGIDPNALSHDVEMVERYKTDPLITHKVSLRLYREMGLMIARKLEIAKRIDCPVLVLQAGEDLIVSKKETFLFYEQLDCAPKEMEVFGGFYHEVLNETNRSAVLARISVWMNQIKHV